MKEELYYIGNFFGNNFIDIDDVEETFSEISIKELKEYGVSYLIEIPDRHGNTVGDDNIYGDDVLKYENLSELVDGFMIGFDEDEDGVDDSVELDDNFFQNRELSLIEEHFILKMNTKTKKMYVVKKHEINNILMSIQNKYRFEK